MKPSGSGKPLLYFLGDMPDADADRENMQMAGRTRDLLDDQIPRGWEKDIRWNNVIRTHTPNNRVPSFVETECCRPSVVSDIVKTKPKVIVSFGAVPLTWLTGQPGIANWRGHKAPVTFGSHSAWAYFVNHPSYLLQQRRDNYRGGVGSEEERVFIFDMKRIFAEINDLSAPKVWTEAEARRNLFCYDGSSSDHVDKVIAFLRRSTKLKCQGLDIETNRLRPYGDDARILSFALGSEKETVAFAWDHPEAKWSHPQRLAIHNALLDYMLAPAGPTKFAHNLPFELEWFAAQLSLRLPHASRWGCTMVQGSVLSERKASKYNSGDDEFEPRGHSLDFLVRKYFGIGLKALSNVDRANLANTPLDEVLPYNGLDAKFTDMLAAEQARELEAEHLDDTYDIYVRRVPTLVLTQIKGVPVDRKATMRLVDDDRRKVEDASVRLFATPEPAKFKKATGRVLNPGSNKDLVELFETVLNVKRARDRNGKFSVDEEALKSINSPFADALLDLRKAQKRWRTYELPYLPQHDADEIVAEFDLKPVSSYLFSDGCVHPIFNPTLASTGRISCLVAGTPVLTKRGWVPIEQVVVGDYAWTHKNRWRRISRFIFQGVRRTVDLKFNNGYILTGTPDHRIFFYGAWWKLEDLLFVYIKEVANAGEHSKGQKVVPDQGTENYAARSRGAWANTNDDSGRAEVIFDGGAIRQPEKFTLCEKQDRAFESYEGEDWRTASQVDWELLRREGLFYPPCREGSCVCAPTSNGGSVGSQVASEASCGSPHRWRPREQLVGQFSSSNINGSRIDSQIAEADAEGCVIATVTDNGCHETFDLTVEEDHSYLSGFIFSHNCESPNLQNVPIRTKEGKEIRKQFVARKGEVILSADYGQIEHRVAAMLSKDKKTVEALWNGFDVHADWARRIIEAYPSRLGGRAALKDAAAMKAFRNDPIKSGWTFALIFGASLDTVSNYIEVPKDILAPLVEEFWDEFRGLLSWQKRTMQFYRENGYVETMGGWRRRAPMTANMIYNAPIQGTACELIMDAMARLSETGDPVLQPNLQIHDDLTFIVPVSEVADRVDQIVDAMLDLKFDFINVPISVEVSVGRSLYDMEDVLTASSDTWKRKKA